MIFRCKSLMSPAIPIFYSRILPLLKIYPMQPLFLTTLSPLQSQTYWLNSARPTGSRYARWWAKQFKFLHLYLPLMTAAALPSVRVTQKTIASVKQATLALLAPTPNQTTSPSLLGYLTKSITLLPQLGVSAIEKL